MRRPLLLMLAGAVVGSAALPAAALTAPPGVGAAPAAKPGARANFAGLIALPGGRRIFLQCRGTGGPTIILESGLRNTAGIWSEPLEPGQTQPTVFAALAKRTHVCAYDRPGTTLGADQISRSDPVRMPRLASDAVADLGALTRAAAIPGPYILVAHSTGGLLARLFTSTHPASVRGLVLVDAIPETVERSLTVTQWNDYSGRYLVAPPKAFAGYANLEAFDFVASFAQMRRVSRLPRRIPLFVLSKGAPFGVTPAPLGAAVERAWRTGQVYLTALEPRTPHVTVRGLGHYFLVERPQVVIDAVGRVLDAVRAGRRTVGSA